MLEEALFLCTVLLIVVNQSSPKGLKSTQKNPKASRK